MSAFNLEISATIDPEVQIPWSSRVAICLLHRHRLIGKKTLRKTYIIPDEDNEVKIRLESLNIQNLVALKAFFENLMPKNGVTQEESAGLAVTAALDHDDSANELSISIELDYMAMLSISCLDFKRCDESIRISFKMSSPSPVYMSFGQCQFILKKGTETLALLDGRFAIHKGEDSVVMEGDIDFSVNYKLFAGTGNLMGFKTYEHNNTFLAHAIRLFKTEVKLS
ncbi:uncharacterized protein TRIREDRAFT_102789 [Trichoderma reesei QM6a]|uniref:Predicted protein n=1 Tax=Hypocrea jecorina (strain QM6a) TaxID=431241 RepID=G0R8A0_HYPJQ|nr:uncharacterized protein TRIREDRAFT_102789 [Trichoderma reesei QM6a]EGR52842.1 predicted protein [Trichoderma reesei QM6a]